MVYCSFCQGDWLKIYSLIGLTAAHRQEYFSRRYGHGCRTHSAERAAPRGVAGTHAEEIRSHIFYHGQRRRGHRLRERYGREVGAAAALDLIAYRARSGRPIEDECRIAGGIDRLERGRAGRLQIGDALRPRREREGLRPERYDRAARANNIPSGDRCRNIDAFDVVAAVEPGEIAAGGWQRSVRVAPHDCAVRRLDLQIQVVDQRLADKRNRRIVGPCQRDAQWLAIANRYRVAYNPTGLDAGVLAQPDAVGATQPDGIGHDGAAPALDVVRPGRRDFALCARAVLPWRNVGRAVEQQRLHERRAGGGDPAILCQPLPNQRR